jgi:2-oxoglutarate dehydrogenase E1 component
MSQKLAQTSPFFGANIIFINELYQKFLQNPASIDASWAEFFAQNADEIKSVLADYQGPSWAARKLQIIGSDEFDISSLTKKEAAKKDVKAAPIQATKPEGKDLNFRAASLISAYKRFGHLAANLDPLDLTPTQIVPEIDPKNHGISESDLSQEVEIKTAIGLKKLKLAQVIADLKMIYASKIGAEFEYIRNQEQKTWLAHEVEMAMFGEISKAEKIKILKEIIRSEKFEQFLHKRFPGAKRFSIEGGDAAINSIEKIIDVGAKNGVKKIIIGMAHRGRLNTLTGIMGKPYHQMIAGFQGAVLMPENITKSGDVKYHLGHSSTREIDGKKIALSLAFNPSHLEAVNSVVAGRIRAKQDIYGDSEKSQAMALLIHGDAAFAGQGSVSESLVMNGVAGYDTGGVVHLIINNQIGFTANPADSRSSTYASDLAKSIDAPIFHVNGDDVEATVKISDIATRFRQTFKKDVVIDLICYRRYGHNEGDEPLYTQPVMYEKIKNHPNLGAIYSQKLLAEAVISQAEYQKMIGDFESLLASEFEKAATYKVKEADWLKSSWSKVEDGNDKNPKTAIKQKTLQELIAKTLEIPAGFHANQKVLRQLEARKQAVEAGVGIDWGCAESLAFASLLAEGFPLRLSGQDSGRGTFSHRHSILHDTTNGARHSIFSAFAKTAKYEVHDSVLSEFAVLGFEYGYSLANPDALTIWEAQFGDFANGAQVIFDQFIASSEMKWLRKSGLVLLLPHGFEGQGPEHSSARLERYLQACADENLRVCNITNPANFFHALRRQIHGKDRKPLVVMSPKSLLRHKLAVSSLSEFSELNFRPLIGESSEIAAEGKIRKVVLCSGKVYYDLLEAREAKKINDVALIRLEQLYPFPKEELKNEIKKYKNAEIIWCQEEPKNMGAWQFASDLIEEVSIEIKHKFLRAKFVGRVASASPATGFASYHAKEQKNLIDEALS